MQIAGASAPAIIWYCMPKLFWYVICFSSQINMPPFKYPSCESIKDTVCLPGGEISTTAADMYFMALWQPWNVTTIPHLVKPRAVRKMFSFEIEHFCVVVSCSVILVHSWGRSILPTYAEFRRSRQSKRRRYRHGFYLVIMLFTLFITHGGWSENRFWNFIFCIKAVEFFCCLFAS